MDVQLPDGTIVQNVPEGTTRSQLMARVQRMTPQAFQDVKAEGNVSKPPTMFTPSGERPEPSFADPALLRGHPLVRFAEGAASPVIGAVQLGANAVGAGAPVNEFIASSDRRAEEARAQLGNEGIDFWKLGGTVVSPAVLAAMKVPMAASVGGRAAQGAAIGAGFGAASPVADESDYWMKKLGQVGTGAVIGGVIPPVIDAARKGAEVARNIVDPLLPGGAERGASRIMGTAAGPKRAAIEAELARNQELVPGSLPTAPEAAARAGSPEFAALQRIAADHRPSAYSDIAQAQVAARKAAIEKFGKDKVALEAATKLRADNATEGYGAVRNLKIDPRSDVEIMNDAIRSRADSKGEALRDWGRFATTEAQNIERGQNFTPVAGMPRVSERASNFPERAAEAKAAASETISIARNRLGEEKFLENTLALLRETVGMGEKNLQMFLRRPSVHEAVKDAMQSAQETGSYFPTKAGDKFSVGNLQRIKESLDAGIAASKAAAATGKRPELSPAELEGTRKAFIEWLSKKAPEWQAARHQYLLDSGPINEMQVGQQLAKALGKPLGEGERAGVFAQAMREAPQTIKKATGQPRFQELDEVLQPQNLAAVKDVLADLARKAEFERLAPLGRAKAAEAAQPFGLPATGPLNQSYMIFKTVLGRVSKGINEKTLDTLADALQTPKGALKLLQNAPTAKQAQIIDQIISAKLGRGAIAAASELTGESINNVR